MTKGRKNRSNRLKASLSGYVTLDGALVPTSLSVIPKSVSMGHIHSFNLSNTNAMTSANVTFLFPKDKHQLHESARVEYQAQENIVNQLPPADVSRLQKIDRDQLLSYFVGALCSKENIIDANIALKYLCTYPSKKELEKYQVEIRNAQAYYKLNDERLSPGKYRFVAIDKTLYAVKGELGWIIYHSFLSQGQAVAASGIFTVGNQGEIECISNESGHYRIDCDDFIDFLAYMLQTLNNPYLIFDDYSSPDNVIEFNVLLLVCKKKNLEPVDILPNAQVLGKAFLRTHTKSENAKARAANTAAPELHAAVVSLIKQKTVIKQQEQAEQTEREKLQIGRSASTPTFFHIKEPVVVRSASEGFEAPSSPYRAVEVFPRG